MWAYYNEIDPIAVHTLRKLIVMGLIPAGEVDDRSIADVQPEDLDGFTQAHFFAGVAGWGAAALRAGWPDDKPLWTASCPCQPFSVAGRGQGADDPRHLWPHQFRLIRARRPPLVVGEQVSGKSGYGWFDGVASDLEAEHYACRTVDLPALAVDAPHIRHRLYWLAVGDPNAVGQQQREGRVGEERGRPHDADAGVGLEHAHGGGRHGWTRDEGRRPVGRDAPEGADRDVGNTPIAGLEGLDGDDDFNGRWPVSSGQLRPPNGTFWSDAEWGYCADGKVRRAQPGARMLVDGVRGGVAFSDAVPGRSESHYFRRKDAWQGFGNAVVVPLATAHLRAVLEAGL